MVEENSSISTDRRRRVPLINNRWLGVYINNPTRSQALTCDSVDRSLSWRERSLFLYGYDRSIHCLSFAHSLTLFSSFFFLLHFASSDRLRLFSFFLSSVVSFFPRILHSLFWKGLKQGIFLDTAEFMNAGLQRPFIFLAVTFWP